jgi:hypothetical protein
MVDLKYTLADVLAVLLTKARAPRREKLIVAVASRSDVDSSRVQGHSVGKKD